MRRIEGQGSPKKKVKKQQTVTLPLLGAPKVKIPTSTVKPRPAPKAQPGPYTNAERKRVAKAKTQAPYKRAVKAAQDEAVKEQAVKAARGSHTLVARKTDPSIKPKKKTGLLHTLESIPGAIVGTTGVGLGIAARHAIEDHGGKPGRTLKTVDKALTREAEGRGQAVKVSKKVADALTNRDVSVVSTGGGPGALGAARGHRPKTSGAATILASPKAIPVTKTGMVNRTIKDLINFPATAVPSMYVPASAAVEATKGNTKPIKKFAKDVQQTDPVVQLATGHPKKALKLANEHPGFTALEVAGLKGTVGRGAGRVMRAVPGPTRRVASTDRAPQTFPGTDLTKEQTYSRDVIRKGRQVAQEKVNAKRARKLRQKAKDAPDAETADALHAKANKVDPFRMSDAEVRRRMDARVAVNETVRRQNRTKAVSEATRVLTNKGHGKVKPSAAHSLVTQNIIKPTVEDLRAYRAELETQSKTLTGARLRQNRILRGQIDKALKSGKDLPKVAEAARRYADEVMGPRTKKLVQRGMLSQVEADSILVPYATRHMGARSNGKGLVGRDGEVLTAEQIREHMKANGVKEPAYVTQAPNQRGARNFYVTSARPPTAARGPRTGVATLHGTFDAHPDTLIEGAAKAQALIDAFDGHTATIKEFAVRGRSGKVRTLQTKRQADQAVADAFAKDGTRLRAVRINPFAGKQAQLKQLLDRANADHIDPESSAGQAIVESLRDAVKKDAAGEGPWALLPEVAADQLQQHLARMTAGPGGKALQVLSGQFRKTVLSTSPSWLTGNVVEASARSAVGRAGPTSYLTGKRVMAQLGGKAERPKLLKLTGGRFGREIVAKDPQAAQELSARALGGGHYSMADRTTIHRDVSQFEGNRVLHPTAKALSAFFHAPGPKQAAGIWHAYTDFVFRAMNGKLETQFQTAMLGKALRDSNLMSGSVLKLGHKAIDEAVQGLTDTNTQARFAAEVERMYGKYQAFSPGMRGMIAMYTPFIAWTLNAVRFVYSVLPHDHPTLTALTVATERATEEWRKQHGLDLFIKGALPGFLQGSIPTKDGGHQRFPNRYLPFGAFGDPLASAGNTVLPQWRGVLYAFDGKDWKGQDLKDKSPGGKAKAAMSSFLEGTIPALSQAQNISRKGLEALNPAATVKPKKGGRVVRTPEQVQQKIDNAISGGDKTDRIDRAVAKAMGY